LTIAIPTFNRANRLEKSLNNLAALILASGCREFLSVLVCNNGSTDATTEVIARYREIFDGINVVFIQYASHSNLGFDANVLACYNCSESKYVWFLSDDDNVVNGAIETIVKDILEYKPNVLYYNFDQYPYTKDNLYISETAFYDCFEVGSMQSVKKIIDWPKLTSIVVQKKHIGEISKNHSLGFMHVALALGIGLTYGRIFHSSCVIARPDDDYMDHIDFPPYIVNNLNCTVKIVLTEAGQLDICSQLTVRAVDPLSSSLCTLGSFYRGKYVLTKALKAELQMTIKRELKSFRTEERHILEFLVCASKFGFSYLYYIVRFMLTGKRVTQLRAVNI